MKQKFKLKNYLLCSLPPPIFAFNKIKKNLLTFLQS